MTSTATSPESRHLSVVPTKDASKPGTLTRAQVATRLGVSVSTVRRYEGDRLHPRVGEDDVRWFDDKEVAALAVSLASRAWFAAATPRRAPALTPHRGHPARSQRRSSSVSNSDSRSRRS